MSTSVKKIFLLIMVFAAASISGQTKFEHHINRIATEVSENGALLFRRSNVLQATWPYDSRYFDMDSRKNYQESWGTWLGVKDFLGVNDSVPSNSVVACGNFYINLDNIVPLSLQKRIRYPYPKISVSDGGAVKYESFDAATVVPSLTCDEQIESVWTTTLGLTVQLKTYAFSTKENANYIIYDYRFLNTGNVDKNTSTRELSRELKGVYFGFSFSTDIKPKYGGKDYDDMFHYYGSTYPDWVNGNVNADSARILYVWDGDLGTGNYDPDPITLEPRVPGYYGIGFLHVDKQAIDDLETGSSDDPAQPKNVSTASGLESSNQYQKLSQGGNVLQDGKGAENFLMSCGPYDIPINEDVRIVIVQIIDGISREKSAELGAQLLAGTISKSQYESVIATGKDSLFKSFSAAKVAYKSNFNLPDPPPSPDSLKVTSGVGRNILKWSSNAEKALDPDTKVADFAGYRVYRAPITPNNTWEKIFECGGNTGIPITNTFSDSTIVLGFNYYYAVTSFDDGSQNKKNPGLSLESSRLTSTAYIGASASMPAQTNTDDFKSKLRVVPNPYNIRAKNYGDPNDAGSTENNKLLFVGLPGKCTIRIYTVAGDLVKTIEHTNGLGSEAWDQITDNNQFIVSGLYIAYVDSELGEETIKFVVIR